jgi:hypothetical protein
MSINKVLFILTVLSICSLFIGFALFASIDTRLVTALFFYSVGNNMLNSILNRQFNGE